MSEKLPDLAVDLLKYNIEVQLERGVSLQNRIFTLMGEVNMDMFHRTEACLNIFENSGKKTVTIKLCSGGGDIYAALAIVARIKSSPCKIRIEAFGQIMSAATAIFAVGDERISSKYTSFMFHQTSVALPELTLRDIRNELEQTEKDDAVFSEILAEHSKCDFNFWNGLICNGKNTYMTAQQCFECGLVDKIT